MQPTRVVRGTLRRLTRVLDTILGASLFGVYLYGSLTQRAFDPARSDIDCIVVVRRDLTDAQLRKLRQWLAEAGLVDRWIPRLQMQLLLKGRLLRPDARGYLYQFAALRRSGSDGNPIIWMNALASGLTLRGPAPATFLPPITSEMLYTAWALETLPPRWHSLIRSAVESDRGKRSTLALPRIARFIEFVGAQLDESLA